MLPWDEKVPLIGFHSVIESPERVRRTNPPKTTRNATMKAKMKSQFITARLRNVPVLSWCGVPAFSR
jgi:hypothetical protein